MFGSAPTVVAIVEIRSVVILDNTLPQPVNKLLHQRGHARALVVGGTVNHPCGYRVERDVVRVAEVPRLRIEDAAYQTATATPTPTQADPTFPTLWSPPVAFEWENSRTVDGRDPGYHRRVND